MIVRTQTAISTMNLSDHSSLIKAMNVRGESITINQVTNSDSKVIQSKNNAQHTLLSFRERGLSRSRNRAIDAAHSEILVIADDDMHYENDYNQTITGAYDKLPKADIIIFHVDSGDPRQQKKLLKRGRLNRIMTLKVASWQITFKRESILNSKIRFDENFGAGTQNYMGEENIFLYDAIRKGLRVYYVPSKIATLDDEAESTWFDGYTIKYFLVKGAVFKRISVLLCPLLIIQFAIRKYPVYKNCVTFSTALQSMVKGAYS